MSSASSSSTTSSTPQEAPDDAIISSQNPFQIPNIKTSDEVSCHSLSPQNHHSHSHSHHSNSANSHNLTHKDIKAYYRDFANQVYQGNDGHQDSSHQQQQQEQHIHQLLDRYHLYTVIHTLSEYKPYQNRQCQHVLKHFMMLKEEHREWMYRGVSGDRNGGASDNTQGQQQKSEETSPSQLHTDSSPKPDPITQHILQPLATAIEHNDTLISYVLSDYPQELSHLYQMQQNPELDLLGFGPAEEGVLKGMPSAENMHKLESTLKQCVRDWSHEGLRERRRSYGPILDHLEKLFPSNNGDRASIRVLSPGSGLGRLPYEIVKKGFSSEGNEFSYFMLLFSNFLLNRTQRVGQFEVYPWINKRSNLKKRKHQFESYQIPDEVAALELSKNRESQEASCPPPQPEFSMAAGDFIDLYSQQPNKWDAVCTCFFIDTARNIFEYVETIWTTLKPGGVWINNGPLLYHFADMAHHFSIELSQDELMRVIEAKGFQIEKQEYVEACQYASHEESMLRQEYECLFFVARKPE